MPYGVVLRPGLTADIEREVIAMRLKECKGCNSTLAEGLPQSWAQSRPKPRPVQVTKRQSISP